MDMTSLSSTLPGNPNGSSARRQNPSKQHTPDIADDGQNLIEAFQSAARSVTQLYRSSASLIRNSRQDGYTDALSDVLEAIDNESAYKDPSLALSRIRDWVIDRRHEIRGGAAGGNAAGRSDSIPPQQQREMSTEEEMEDGNAKEEEGARRDEPRPEVSHQYSDLPHQHPQLQSIPQFSFQSLAPLPPYPTQAPSIIEGPQSPGIDDGIFTFNSPSIPNGRAGAGSKVPLAPRNNNPGVVGLGGGAGTKRRNQYADFFDLNGFGNFGMNGTSNGGRDTGNSGGGQGNTKRGRYA